jgi:hypothetical protein
MNLDYRISDEWEEDEIDLSDADATELRYNVALGDILLSAGEVDLSAPWGWVPLLDFALALQEIARKLAHEGASEVFEFTESGAELRFDRKGAKIVITATYGPGELKVSMPTLEKKTKDFAVRIGKDLKIKYPELKENRVFQGWELFQE